jgi:hypothetical protein
MDDKAREKRVQTKARQLWQEHGSPEGRESDYLDQASELVAIEESQKDTLKPNPQADYARNPTTEPVEPLLAVENAGEFPTLTDEGEEVTYPSRKNYAQADEAPLSDQKRR